MGGKVIPKVMNFFWSGKILSWMRYMTLYSFKKLNPDWEVVLYVSSYNDIKKKPWPDNNVQEFFSGYSEQDYFSKVSCLGLKIREVNGITDKLDPVRASDVFRWYLLYKQGGFYSDMDILYVKPLESFYQKVCKYETVMAYTSSPTNYFSIGFLGSVPGNVFFRDLFEVATSRVEGCYQTSGTVSIYQLVADRKDWHKVVPHTNQLALYHKKYGVNIFTDFQSAVYPYSYRQIEEIFASSNKQLPKESIALHWFAGAALAQKFNKKLTHKNYMNYNNLFCHLAMQVLKDK